MVRNELNREYSWDEPERASWQEGRMEGRLQVKRRKDEVGGEAEQGPEGRVSSSLNTAQTSERETLPHMGETSSSNSDFVFHAY